MTESIVLLLLLVVLIFAGCIYLIMSTFYRITRKKVYVPFVPADAAGISAMCKAVGLRGDEKVIDLGSGWGTIVFYLAKKYPKLRITGIELHPVLHLIAKLHQLLGYQSRDITLIRGDAAAVSLESFDIVFLFMLSPFVNQVLVPKFEKELRKGAMVVSYVFPMKSKSFQEEKVQLPVHGWKNAVYIYRKISA